MAPPFDPANPPAWALRMAEAICEEVFAQTGESLNPAHVVHGFETWPPPATWGVALPLAPAVPSDPVLVLTPEVLRAVDALRAWAAAQPSSLVRKNLRPLLRGVDAALRAAGLPARRSC